jgi:hypothetical protein
VRPFKQELVVGGACKRNTGFCNDVRNGTNDIVVVISDRLELEQEIYP